MYLRQGKPEQAIEMFDSCMDANGREFHSLAYKAHTLDDAGRHDEACYLLDFDKYVKTYKFEPPKGYGTIDDFREAWGAMLRRIQHLRLG